MWLRESNQFWRYGQYSVDKPTRIDEWGGCRTNIVMEFVQWVVVRRPYLDRRSLSKDLSGRVVKRVVWKEVEVGVGGKIVVRGWRGLYIRRKFTFTCGSPALITTLMMGKSGMDLSANVKLIYQVIMRKVAWAQSAGRVKSSYHTKKKHAVSMYTLLVPMQDTISCKGWCYQCSHRKLGRSLHLYIASPVMLRPTRLRNAVSLKFAGTVFKIQILFWVLG